MFRTKARARKDQNRILAGFRDVRNARPWDVPSDKCAAPHGAECHKAGMHIWPCTYSPAPQWPTRFGHENTVMGGFDDPETIKPGRYALD